jgi:hypothetical protein
MRAKTPVRRIAKLMMGPVFVIFSVPVFMFGQP